MKLVNSKMFLVTVFVMMNLKCVNSESETTLPQEIHQNKEEKYDLLLEGQTFLSLAEGTSELLKDLQQLKKLQTGLLQYLLLASGQGLALYSQASDQLKKTAQETSSLLLQLSDYLGTQLVVVDGTVKLADTAEEYVVIQKSKVDLETLVEQYKGFAYQYVDGYELTDGLSRLNFKVDYFEEGLLTLYGKLEGPLEYKQLAGQLYKLLRQLDTTKAQLLMIAESLDTLGYPGYDGYPGYRGLLLEGTKYMEFFAKEPETDDYVRELVGGTKYLKTTLRLGGGKLGQLYSLLKATQALVKEGLHSRGYETLQDLKDYLLEGHETLQKKKRLFVGIGIVFVGRIYRNSDIVLCSRLCRIVSYRIVGNIDIVGRIGRIRRIGNTNGNGGSIGNGRNG